MPPDPDIITFPWRAVIPFMFLFVFGLSFDAVAAFIVRILFSLHNAGESYDFLESKEYYHMNDTGLDDWEACGYLGILVAISLLFAASIYGYYLLIQWLRNYLPPWLCDALWDDTTPQDIPHEQGLQALRNNNGRTQKTHNSHDTGGGNSTAAHTSDSSHALPAPEPALSQDSLYPPLKPFPFKNFDLGDRKRPFEFSAQSTPWSPILPCRAVTVAVALFEGDEQRDDYEGNFGEIIDVLESEKEDTGLVGAFTVEAVQRVTEPDEVGAGLVEASVVAVAEEIEAPTSYAEKEASATYRGDEASAMTEYVEAPAVTGEVEAPRDPFVATPTPPNNAGATNATVNVPTVAVASLVGFERLQPATFSDLHPVGDFLATQEQLQNASFSNLQPLDSLLATPQHNSRSGIEDLLLPPSPKQLLKIALDGLDEKKTGLLCAVCDFNRVVDGSRIYEDAVAAILDWLQEAEEDLKPHIQYAQFADLIKDRSWFRAIHGLHEYFQQHINYYVADGASDLVDFAEKIAEFEKHLQLSMPACITAQPQIFPVFVSQQLYISAEPMEDIQTAGSTAAPPINSEFGTSSLDIGISKHEFVSARQGRTTTRRSVGSGQRVTRASPSSISRTISGVGKPSPTGSPSRREQVKEDEDMSDFSLDQFDQEGSW